MKCPKCGYLGFETSDQCRNCGYDFSLSMQMESPAELPLRHGDGAGAPLADFDLSSRDTLRTSENAVSLDLDRLIGNEQPFSMDSAPEPARPPASVPHKVTPALPLFTPRDELDESPLAPPRPARPPLSVRRTTPEIPRLRPRSRRVTPPTDDAGMALELEPAGDVIPTAKPTLPRHEVTTEAPAGLGARLLAALIDLVLLGAVDVAVLYLTLAIAGLTIEQAPLIPGVPMGAFLVMMNGGYLVVLTAANGQTIGKMMTGIRVIGDDAYRVGIPEALLRAAGCAVSLLTLGLGYLPALLSADRRALQDRMSGTRVVRAT